MGGQLTEADVQTLYTWIDEIPISRPKRNLTRDFSDGVAAAEVVHHYFPKLVEMHNYSPANALAQKMYNWNTLNSKVFKKLGYSLSDETMRSISNNKTGCVELMLLELRKKLEEHLLKKSRSTDGSISSYGGFSPVSPNGTMFGAPQSPNGRSGSVNPGDKAKDHIISDLQETIQILQVKVSKMEELLRLKDKRIQELLGMQQQAQ